MSLGDAIKKTGPIPSNNASRNEKKRYSEVLSQNLAVVVAGELEKVGFKGIKPSSKEGKEKEFQGGLGPKKVDVSFSDERHGLKFAVSIKTINFPQFGRNLKNRFSDLYTEAITLHLRFPYSVICALFVFPFEADHDKKARGTKSTFQRTLLLMNTISGRVNYSEPGERFEHVACMLYQPISKDTKDNLNPKLELHDCGTGMTLTEKEYFIKLRELFNLRNPHVQIPEN